MLPKLSIEDPVYARIKNLNQTIFVHRCQKITRKELKEDLKSYRAHLPKDGGETVSCTLDVEDIKALINYYSDPRKGSNPIDGIRIYFVRGGKHANPLKDGTKRQLNIILVPTHKGKLGYEDMFDSDDACWVLSPGGETTGLCPTNCGGSEG